MVIVDDDGDCLKDGDDVYLQDRTWFNTYYLTSWPTGSWRGHIFLWESNVGPYETFTVRIEE